MWSLLAKALISGVLVALVSEIGKRQPAVAALVGALPLVFVLGISLLRLEGSDTEKLAAYSSATFWYVLVSLPMLLAIPAMLRAGFGFWLSLGLGCALTAVLYMVAAWLGLRFGLKL